MDPQRFLRLARDILGDDPVRCRCAIGRAYYAAFNVAAAILRELGCTIPKNAAAHGAVISHLRWSGNAELMDAAAKIEDLKNVRNASDYDMGNIPRVEKEANAKFHITVAQAVIDLLRQVLNGPQRETILAEMNRNRAIVNSPKPSVSKAPPPPPITPP